MMKKVLTLLLLGTGFASYGQNTPKFNNEAEKEKWVKENPEAYQELLRNSKASTSSTKVVKTSPIIGRKVMTPLEQIIALKADLEKNKNNTNYNRNAVESKIKALKIENEIPKKSKK